MKQEETYCTNCAKEHNAPVSIDIKAIFKKLTDPEYEDGFRCTGCGLFAIANMSGRMWTKKYIGENKDCCWRLQEPKKIKKGDIWTIKGNTQ